ncbi:ribosomal protein S5, C-terminal domain-containing protein [Xylariaceae sp. FL0016]|nr:ribosomal protein S5, C-terminal domain-containing protein [Xylariaceae sp. FL0016]
MSAVQPVRCLLSRRLATTVHPPAPRCHAPFHSSVQLAGRRRPRFKSVRAEEMGLVTPEKVEEFTKESFPAYTPQELEVLKQKYTPEQMAALEAGEAAIDPKDLTIQGRIRKDPYQLPYLDDFSKILPIIDKRPKTGQLPHPNPRFLSEVEEEHSGVRIAYENKKQQKEDGLDDVLDDSKPQESEDELEKLIGIGQKEGKPHAKESHFGDGTMNDWRPADSAVAPALGKGIPDVEGMYKTPIDPADDGLDDLGIYQNLKRRTRMSVQDIQAIQTKVIVTRFVHNQTRLGKIESYWVCALSGTGNGTLGVGVAKSTDSGTAVQKAKLLSVQNMRPIRRYEDRTIYGNVTTKVGATIVQLEARPPGFGIRASHRLFEIFRMVGIHDIAAKMPRSRNPMNSVKACVQALQNQKDPNEIAIGRGKKLVDVRKVYFGGNVL